MLAYIFLFSCCTDNQLLRVLCLDKTLLISVKYYFFKYNFSGLASQAVVFAAALISSRIITSQFGDNTGMTALYLGDGGKAVDR